MGVGGDFGIGTILREGAKIKLACHCEHRTATQQREIDSRVAALLAMTALGVVRCPSQATSASSASSSVQAYLLRISLL